ncbi:MAG TPA: GAF domain-containing protein, partial [Anaerolineae bacterium]
MFSLAAQPTSDFPWSSLSLTVSILIVSLLLSAYVLWRRYRSRRFLVQRIAELEALSAAGRAIVTAELDVGALSELIAREAGRVIDNSTFQVGLFEDGLYHILFWSINGQEQETPRTFDLRENSGMVGWIRDSKQPLLVRDFHREMDALPARPRYVSVTPPRSAVFIPLISGEDVIGVIAAQSSLPNRFDEEDLRRLMILANQAAAAIAHARLYAQAKQRAAHLELVGKIARQINTSHDQAEIFDQVVRLTRHTFGLHPVSIFAVDPQTGDAMMEASSATELLEHNLRLAPGEGLVGAAIATRETVVSNNTGEDERFIAHIGPPSATLATVTCSEMVIPLVVNGEVLGVLDLQSPQAGAFTAAEKATLEALAAEVAIALDKVRQLARQREQAWITTAQLQVAEAISRSADLDELVTAVTRLTPMLVGVSFCSILLWDEDTAVYRGTSLYCCTVDTTAPDFDEIQVAIGDWPALDAVHVGQQALTTHKIPAWLKRAVGALSLAEATLFPISVASRVFGVMIVGPFEAAAGDNGGGDSYSRREELLYDIAGQTAQAIESAYLRNAQQEEAWVNTALLQVAEAVNSLIDLNEILDTIIRLIPMLVGVESAIILIWDEEEQVFRVGPSHGIDDMGLGLLATLQLDRDEFAAITPQSADFLSPGATHYAIQLPPWMVKVLGTSRAYALPLHARGRLVGALVVGVPSQNGRAMSTRRLNILNGIAHQAATAVVNNQLYQEAAERSRLEQELSVAHEIQASLIPPGNPAIPGCSVASSWEAARQVSGDFYDFLQ